MASILKKINRNTLLIKDCGVEKIVIGKGIGFRANRHRQFNMELADQVFVLDTEEESKRFLKANSNNPYILKQFI